MNKTAVVILNWNGKHFLQQFLPALVEHTSLPGVALVVADNGSTDCSQAFLQQAYPQIRQIVFDKNYGFTGGYNRALSQVDADYYVLLNSDVEVTANWLQPLKAALDNHPEVAVCMPKIRSFDRRTAFEYAGAAGGFIDRYGFPFCRGRILSCIEEDNGQYDTPRRIFWASGACMMIRAAVFHRLGGFDDDFFAHMEEIDLCWRVQQLGYSVMCLPQAVVYHVGGGTLPNETPFKLYLNYRNNLYMLYKNLPDRKRFLLAVRLVLDGLSAGVYCLRGKFASFAAVWKAHIHFWQRRKNLRTKRLPQRNHPVAHIYPSSVVLGFYLSKKKRTFGELEFGLRQFKDLKI
ncbi:MAG: glycosyltransferase family 2 protein [Prevotellaceae bacterium]|jgi:GT2 family glycosyltransferase|nr:glycosyltransferase family 2 protein [Prevotellaceae bacterium]